MKLKIANTESVFNRATRRNEVHEVVCGQVTIPADVSNAIRRLAPAYRTDAAGMILLALQCYFGDGADHLHCEFCDFYSGQCEMPPEGEQTTMPLLD